MVTQLIEMTTVWWCSAMNDDAGMMTPRGALMQASTDGKVSCELSGHSSYQPHKASLWDQHGGPSPLFPASVQARGHDQQWMLAYMPNVERNPASSHARQTLERVQPRHVHFAEGPTGHPEPEKRAGPWNTPPAALPAFNIALARSRLHGRDGADAGGGWRNGGNDGTGVRLGPLFSEAGPSVSTRFEQRE